jgi:glucose 1-dehydrogenase
VKDQVALVTGAASGIGRATAVALGESDWRVVGVDIHSSEAPHPRCRMVVADVSDADRVEGLFRDIERHERQLDAVVNAAAIPLTKPLLETSQEEWDRVMAVNVRSIFLTIRSAAPRMPAGSVIVNVGSVHALATSPGMAAYVASKGAVVTLTRAAALELAPFGIRVNAVLPGAIDTPMLRAGLKRSGLGGTDPDARMQALAEATPLERIGQPDEIARVILFLTDSRSGFMTGQAIVVDGGATARLATE